MLEMIIIIMPRPLWKTSNSVSLCVVWISLTHILFLASKSNNWIWHEFMCNEGQSLSTCSGYNLIKKINQKNQKTFCLTWVDLWPSGLFIDQWFNNTGAFTYCFIRSHLRTVCVLFYVQGFHLCSLDWQSLWGPKTLSWNFLVKTVIVTR